jgi:hypothetical protein
VHRIIPVQLACFGDPSFPVAFATVVKQVYNGSFIVPLMTLSTELVNHALFIGLVFLISKGVALAEVEPVSNYRSESRLYAYY